MYSLVKYLVLKMLAEILLVMIIGSTYSTFDNEILAETHSCRRENPLQIGNYYMIGLTFSVYFLGGFL